VVVALLFASCTLMFSPLPPLVVLQDRAFLSPRWTCPTVCPSSHFTFPYLNFCSINRPRGSSAWIWHRSVRSFKPPLRGRRVVSVPRQQLRRACLWMAITRLNCVAGDNWTDKQSLSPEHSLLFPTYRTV
jgi:hypothetical protein